MIPQPPGSIAMCGTEPTYYMTGPYNIRMESSQHSSWELCVMDWVSNHPSYRFTPAPTSPTTGNLTPTPYVSPSAPPRPIADTAQIWVTQHNDLMIAIGVAAVLILVVLFLVISTRRVNRAARKAEHQ